MQILRSYLLIITVLSLHVDNIACMEIKIEQPLECFKKSNNIDMEVPSLKKLCINKIATSIQKNNIDALISKDAMEKISSLPKELQEKITANLFCYKPGYQHSYEKESVFDHDIMLDEINNQVMFTDKPNAILTLLTINGETINSFPWSNIRSLNYCHNGSLIVQQNDYYKNSITIIKDGKMKTINGVCSPQYCSLEKILKNQHELIFWKNKKYTLYNFYQGSEVIYDKVDSIQFDNSETICMMRDGDKVIISTPKRNDKVLTCVTINGPNAGGNKTETVEEFRNEYETQIVFHEMENAYLNPNGKQLLIKCKNQPVKLIRIKGEETVFSFEKFKGTINIHTVNFSHDGNYLILSQYIPEEGLFYHILDTKKGKSCMCFRLPINTNPLFDKKYLILQHFDQVCLVPIKNLDRMNNFSTNTSHIYTIEEIIELGIGKTFNDFEGFHPNGKHIILRPNYQWQLIDPKSEKPIFIVDNIIRNSFSEPAGKMLFLENCWYTGYEVLSLRNDFTVEEYLLNRFMTEKNIAETDLLQYPHMQEIYNKMDKDKRLFHCLDNGRRKTDSYSCVIS